MTQPDPDRRPVIVGVADVLDRPATPGEGRHPLQLLVAAIHAADLDGGGRWLAKVGAIDVVNLMSWPYLDLPGQIKTALGLPAAVPVVHGPVGGESPLRYLQNAAQAIAGGALETAVICGAECLSTFMKAGMAGVALDWPARDPAYRMIRAEDLSPPEALKYGLRSPVDIYPLYENATRAHWGQSFAAAQGESATIWAQFSEVAARNPYAWLPKAVAPETISTFTDQNRPIAWPYSKLMIANNAVNLGAAVIVTSYGAARAAGLGDDRLVFIWDGCAAAETRSVLDRDSYRHSSAQDTVLTQTLARNRLTAQQLDFTELYSCFPCVPKMARRTLGFGLEGGPFTVAGGLTFFGAPLNAYMVHAATAMVRKLRAGESRERAKAGDAEVAGNQSPAPAPELTASQAPRCARYGLLYGQGEFVTKHHALVVASAAPPAGVATGDASVQAIAEAARGPVPALHDGYVGDGKVETFTVWFDRKGAPQRGVVIARNEAGARFVARLPKFDQAALARFTSGSWEPVGTLGRSTAAADGLVDWSIVV